MKHVNLAYVNLAFVVVAVIVIGYTFSVTFLSSTQIQDQPVDLEILSSPQEQSLEIPAGVSPENSATRRNPGSPSGLRREPPSAAEVRSSPSRTPASRNPSDVQRPGGTALPNVTTVRPARTPRTRPPSAAGAGQQGSGFVVTPSQRSEPEKRSAPQNSPRRPPVRGSMSR